MIAFFLYHQMDVSGGSVAVTGRVAYVSQQPWILNDSVRENIVFDHDYDENRLALKNNT